MNENRPTVSWILTTCANMKEEKGLTEGCHSYFTSVFSKSLRT